MLQKFTPRGPWAAAGWRRVVRGVGGYSWPGDIQHPWMLLKAPAAASSRRTAALAAALRSPGPTTGPGMAAAAATGALTEAELAGVRGYFGGSGSDGMNTDLARDTILRLADKKTPTVLYVGTPTYDLLGPFEAQTGRFAEVGCPVTQLRLVEDPPAAEEMAALVRGADVIVVSGGNPLYAVARWQALGVDALLREAMASGTVMCGGSCGLISWFDAGHSDSADPASYKEPMLRGAATYALSPPPAPPAHPLPSLRCCLFAGRRRPGARRPQP